MKRDRTPEKTAMDMTAANYMNSTTKFMRAENEKAVAYPSKAKIEKIIRGEGSLSPGNKSQHST